MSNTFQLYAIVFLSGLFGASEAFLYPAILALLPRFVRKSQLAQANAWMQGSEQISNMIGPAIAGLAISAFRLTIAFGLNTVLFAMGAGCIYQVRTRSGGTASLESPSLAGGILEGLRYAWNHSAIRTSLMLIAMINFALLGPIVVGVAEVVTVRFGGDATTFGYLQSAYGLGALLGVWIASQIDVMKQLKTPLLLLTGVLGCGLITLGFVSQAWIAALIIFSMGIGGGLVTVLALTWLQQKTAIAMQGRMMSLVMFAAVALDPFSQAISGALLDINLTGLFVLTGSTMLGTTFIVFFAQTRDRPS